LAPYNLGVLAKNEFDFAITAKDRSLCSTCFW